MDTEKLVQMLTLPKQPQAFLQQSRGPQLILTELSNRSGYATVSHK